MLFVVTIKRAKLRFFCGLYKFVLWVRCVCVQCGVGVGSVEDALLYAYLGVLSAF